MAEGGFDPCECICSHEGAMRRLISMLRDSQQTCSDSQCDLQLPGTEGVDPAQDGGYYMMMMMGWMVMALVLFLFRPASMRGGRGDDKPAPSNHNPGPPPAPPVD